MAVKAPGSLRVIGSSVVDWWDSMLDWVVIMLVWMAFQLTIVFGPPATFGLYSIINAHILTGESQGIRGMFEAGKKYFGKAWIWAAINIAAIVLWVINFQFYNQFQQIWSAAIQGLLLVVLLIWTFMQFYIIPFYIEQQDKRLRTAFRNALMTSLAAPFFTFVLMLFVLIIALLSMTVVLPLIFGFLVLIPILGTRAMFSRLEAFGLREPEVSPKELEREMLSRAPVPGQGKDEEEKH
jgi:uncharacterized membrane protein YesL